MPSGADREYFAGKPIKLFSIAEGVADPVAYAYAFSYKETEWANSHDWDKPPYWEEKWRAFLNNPRSSEVSALVIGGDEEQALYGESCEMQIDSLVSSREQLPSLTALCLGYDDQFNHDDNWVISLPDISVLFLAFPQLQDLRLYGWMNLTRGVEFQIGTIHSEALRSFCLATAYLEPRILHDLWRAHLPALEHLELWLHGNQPTVDDLAPLFSGQLFPSLRSLTLSYSIIEDELTEALAASPLLAQLSVLELSKGALTDRGAQALLANSAIRQLEKLILIHHFCSDETVQQLRALPLEVEIDAQRKVDDTYNGVPEIASDGFYV